MRDPIVAIALAGTSRQQRVKIVTGTPIDELIQQLPEGEVERAFLLSAGIWAVYRQAGTLATELATEPSPDPAGDEPLRECSPEAALLLSSLFTGEQQEYLLQALARVSALKLRLPHHMLPTVMDAANTNVLRSALAPVLGERGQWLSQFNDSWKWVNNYLVNVEEGLPAEAEMIWQEGSLGQRIEILRRLRVSEPEKALAWLDAVWKQEKADARSEMLAALEISLSAADEPFLEKALDDRAGSVRGKAAALLTRLPSSALNERMRQRGQSMLQRVKGKIQMTVPETFDKTWERDGITESRPYTSSSQRTWWLFQVISTIDPTFWETHLGAPPEKLLRILQSPLAEEEKTLIIEGWSRAAVLFQRQSWLPSLLAWWQKHAKKVIEKRQWVELGDYSEQFMQIMSARQGEQFLLDVLEKSPDKLPDEWQTLLPYLPQPWSVEFARTYLRLLRANLTAEYIRKEGFSPYSDPWLGSLWSAKALPMECLPEAAQPWEFPENDTRWQVQQARAELKTFTDSILLRKKIDEEIC